MGSQHADRLADIIAEDSTGQGDMRAPTPSSELALRIGFAYPRHPLLKLQQLDRCEYLPNQDAGTIARTEDHYSADTHGQIEIGDDLPKL
jgi:hypothetical protein